MSYQVLARSQRPQNFSEVIGQQSTVATLEHALSSQRLHHAYLFTGTRGVGKTTLARILAKCLNCENSITATPCGQCDSCKEISGGRFIDLIEVDAASRTKVEETRELLENINYAPHKGRFKVYLIDEVHMLSKHSFNALLKTIEEPPEHVKFLFATTDPQKIPATILSRCLQFHLRPVAAETIEKHLEKITQQQEIPAEINALSAIAKAAEGSVRDSLSLLDQAIAHGGGKIETSSVEAMLGISGHQQSKILLKCIAEQNVDQLLEICESLTNQGVDFTKILDQILCDLHKMAIAKTIAASSSKQTPALNTYAEINLSSQQVQLHYQSAIIGKRDLELAPSPRLGFEMVMLRMIAFQQHQPGAAAVINHKPAAKPKTPLRHQAETSSPATKASAHRAESSIANNNNSTTDNNSYKTTTRPNNNPPVAPTDLRQWSGQLIDALGLGGAARALALQCAFVSYQDQKLELQLTPKHKTLLQPQYLQRIEKAVSEHLNNKTSVNITIEEQPENSSPQQQKQQALSDTKQKELQNARKDPNLQKILNAFNVQAADNNLHIKS